MIQKEITYSQTATHFWEFSDGFQCETKCLTTWANPVFSYLPTIKMGQNLFILHLPVLKCTIKKYRKRQETKMHI